MANCPKRCRSHGVVRQNGIPTGSEILHSPSSPPVPERSSTILTHLETPAPAGLLALPVLGSGRSFGSCGSRICGNGIRKRFHDCSVGGRIESYEQRCTLGFPITPGGARPSLREYTSKRGVPGVLVADSLNLQRAPYAVESHKFGDESRTAPRRRAARRTTPAWSSPRRPRPRPRRPYLPPPSDSRSVG